MLMDFSNLINKRVLIIKKDGPAATYPISGVLEELDQDYLVIRGKTNRRYIRLDNVIEVRVDE